MAKRGGPIGIFNGNWKNQWRRDLDDSQDRRTFIIESNQLDFGDALQVLKHHDKNWEVWFDDDANIPPIIYWSNTDDIQELCRRMIERANLCREKVKTP